MDEGRALSALTVPGSAAGPDAPSKAKRSKDDAGGEFPTRGQIVGCQNGVESGKKKKERAPPRNLGGPVPIGGGLRGEVDVHVPAAAASADARHAPALGGAAIGSGPMDAEPTTAPARQEEAPPPVPMAPESDSSEDAPLAEAAETAEAPVPQLQGTTRDERGRSLWRALGY